VSMDHVDQHVDQLSDADDQRLAHELATRAGAGLLALRESRPDADGKEIGAEGDRSSNAYLLAMLAALRPHDVVFSEERKDDVEARRSADRVWIIDPLDGTREYGERRDDWGVHVALWVREHGLVAGAVALPSQGVTVHTELPRLDGPRRLRTGDPIQMVVSRTRPPAWVGEAASAIDGVLLPMGSVGAKVSSILLGHTDAYVHVGAMGEWDTAAPVAVALAAGLHATRLDGSPIEFNTVDGRTHDLVVCRPEFAATLIAESTRLIAEAT
jgi:3'(2'), 5'-bisphosphate nucleotidase